MRRREFIKGLGSTAAWPLAARAPQAERLRRIGVLTGLSENDGKAALSAFARALAGLGWTVGRNVQVDVRFFGGNVDLMRTFAKELIDIQPDLIVADTTPATAALQRETLVIPIVFTAASDPVGSGFVLASLDRAGISQASSTQKHQWRASGWNCSSRSRPASSGPQSCSIPIRRRVVGHIF